MDNDTIKIHVSFYRENPIIINSWTKWRNCISIGNGFISPDSIDDVLSYNTLYIESKDDLDITIEGGGNFINREYNNELKNYGKKYTIQKIDDDNQKFIYKNYENNIICTTDGEYDIIIHNASSITHFQFPHNWHYNWEFNINQFAKCKSLRKLFLHNSGAYGSFDEDLDLPDLKILDVRNTNVEGNLSQFKNLHELEVLSITFSKIKGSIESLKSFSNLEVFKSSNNNIYGNLSMLKSLHNLMYLNISNSLIWGNFGDLAELDQLDYINLRNTPTHGNIKDIIGNDVKRYSLDLIVANTGIIGNIESLVDKYSHTIDSLDISNTAISGKISTLTKFPNLTTFIANNTPMRGNINDLNESFINKYKLAEVSLLNTNVKGKLTVTPHHYFVCTM